MDPTDFTPEFLRFCADADIAITAVGSERIEIDERAAGFRYVVRKEASGWFTTHESDAGGPESFIFSTPRFASTERLLWKWLAATSRTRLGFPSLTVRITADLLPDGFTIDTLVPVEPVDRLWYRGEIVAIITASRDQHLTLLCCRFINNPVALISDSIAHPAGEPLFTGEPVSWDFSGGPQLHDGDDGAVFFIPAPPFDPTETPRVPAPSAQPAAPRTLYRYPPDSGAVPDTRMRTTRFTTYARTFGRALDRYGDETGTYLTVRPGPPTSFESRSLPVSAMQNDYHFYWINRLPRGWALDVFQAGPWFGQDGGAFHVRFLNADLVPIEVRQLLEEGVLDAPS